MFVDTQAEVNTGAAATFFYVKFYIVCRNKKAFKMAVLIHTFSISENIYTHTLANVTEVT